MKKVNAITRMKSFLQDDEAATAAEYGILAALIAVAIIVAVRTFGTNLTAMFNKMSGTISST